MECRGISNGKNCTNPVTDLITFNLNHKTGSLDAAEVRGHPARERRTVEAVGLGEGKQGRAEGPSSTVPFDRSPR